MGGKQISKRASALNNDRHRQQIWREFLIDTLLGEQHNTLVYQFVYMQPESTEVICLNGKFI